MLMDLLRCVALAAVLALVVLIPMIVRDIVRLRRQHREDALRELLRSRNEEAIRDLNAAAAATLSPGRKEDPAT